MNWEKYGIKVPYGRNGRNYKTTCPQCSATRTNPHDRSLSCNLENGLFKCHHCGFSGCAKEPTDGEKQKWMEQQPWYNPHPIRREPRVYKKPTPRPPLPISAKLLAYLTSRGISEATITAMKITEGVEKMPAADGQWRDMNTLQFNYYLGGELINVKYRTGDKRFRLCTGARLIPYNIDAILNTDECIITEGEMDALSFYECGRHDVVSVPNGANSNLEYLDDFIESHFDNKQTIYIASDTDSRGVMLRDELLRRFGPERCRVLEYGEGCKDANEHLMRYGRESLLKCLADAPETKAEGVFTVSDFEQSLDALFDHGMQPGVTIGHDNFDKLCSFETKRLCIVTGIPGSGKSEFIDEMAERLNIRYGWKFAFFSPENAPLAYHASKLIEKFTGSKFKKGYLDIDAYTQVKKHLENNVFFIMPENFRLATILEKAKYLVRRKGIKCLVIDPYNRLEDEAGNGSETRYISRILDDLANFAQQNDVMVILMAHPTKLKKENGVVDPPTLYDISGSAHFYNKADFGIIVHRYRKNDKKPNADGEKNENKVLVRVAKVKFRHLGEPGDAFFRYNIRNGRYSPIDENDRNMWDYTNHLQPDEETRRNEELGFLEQRNDCPF